MAINVQLKAYEGPLDLLLDLIKENKVDIYDIPIVQITDQYMAYLGQMEQLNLSIAGDFLVMAATLLYIKSRMMLPPEDLPPEEEELDPRTELVNKLLEYQAFKEAARDLDLLQEERKLVYTRGFGIDDIKFNPDAADDLGLSNNLFDLIQAFSQVVKSKSLETFHEVYEEVITIESKIESIAKRLEEVDEVPFASLFPEKTTRNELIATFLAVLELTKSKRIYVVQSELFADIVIRKKRSVLDGLSVNINQNKEGVVEGGTGDGREKE